MMKLYALKWRAFTSWCRSHLLDPVNCLVGTVLEFLQDRLTAGLSPSTLKVHVAAIAAYDTPLGGMSVRRHPWVTLFLCGTLRLRPVARTMVPAGDLAAVLKGLSMAPLSLLRRFRRSSLQVLNTQENWRFTSFVGILFVP